MATVLTISVIYSFYFPQIQALKESRPADSETHFQCMDVAAWGLTRGPYESMPGQIHEQKACFALSISAWFNGKRRGHFHTLHNLFPQGKNTTARTGGTARQPNASLTCTLPSALSWRHDWHFHVNTRGKQGDKLSPATRVCHSWLHHTGTACRGRYKLGALACQPPVIFLGWLETAQLLSIAGCGRYRKKKKYFCKANQEIIYNKRKKKSLDFIDNRILKGVWRRQANYYYKALLPGGRATFPR